MMIQHLVKIKSIKHISHDVLIIVTEKPPHYSFNPGQATEVAINRKEWKDEKRPFTFTCLPDDDFLEFTIKTYPSHKGVTNELLQAKKDDELILHDVFGAIAYKGEGLFIAGGAGITPFISIFRYLQARNKPGNNKLIFANNTKADIIHEQELKSMLRANFINILSHQDVEGYAHGLINTDFLKAHITGIVKNIYLCGPPSMMKAVEMHLENLNIDENSIVKETF